MKPTPQGPNTRHPVSRPIEVATEPTDPQDRLANRQRRRCHPAAEVTGQRLGLLLIQQLQGRGLGGLPRPVTQGHDPGRHRAL